MKKAVTRIDFQNLSDDVLAIDFYYADGMDAVPGITISTISEDFTCSPDELTEIYEEVRKYLPKKKRGKPA